jgi:hypothetical protein
MTDTREKARALRLERLAKMLSERLTHAAAALETLVDELGRGEARLAEWESLHVAAARDDQAAELGDAYRKLLSPHRMRALAPALQAEVLLHAAGFFQGILGDVASAELFLERVLEVVPEHAEALDRLERRRRATDDRRGLIRLYALVAGHAAVPIEQLAARIADLLLVPLPQRTPLADDTCRRLLPLIPFHPRLLDLLDAHCQATGRSALGCELREQALASAEVTGELEVAMRRRLLERYLEHGSIPPAAIDHAEALIARVPGDSVAMQAADRLLRARDVASRAAALLKDARSLSRRPPPRA